jgi:hypothetical protein
VSPRFAYLYFMKDDPDRIGATVPSHVAHWHQQQLPGYLGGSFEDRTGGLITFQAQDDEQPDTPWTATPSSGRASWRRPG